MADYRIIMSGNSGKIDIPEKSEPETNFTVHTFTNCGKEGRYGPSLSQCQIQYSGSEILSDNYAFEVNQGVQSFTVPVDGVYKIEAAGARGGFNYYGYGSSATHSLRTDSGRGAVLSGDFNLEKGTVINIVVGQVGADGIGNHNTGASGGGGSFVYTGSASGSGLLLAAGGGASVDAEDYPDSLRIRDANTGTSGKDNVSSDPSVNFAGGVNGNPGVSKDGNYYGGSGAGWLGKSVNISQNYKNGGLFIGGYDQRNTSCAFKPEGGFGGGASHDSQRCDMSYGTGLAFAHGKGAGGGYSGGGSSYYMGISGGGGSFVSSKAISGTVFTSDGSFIITGSEPQSAYNGSVKNNGTWNNTHGYVSISLK
jgi:hypothetical protein